MTETWAAAPMFEGLYEVSSFGGVRRDVNRPCVWPVTNSPPGRPVKARLQNDGYPIVGLYRDGKTRTVSVHRLVALAFLGPRPEGAEVNHKDGDKTNNRADNLEYVSHRRNMAHAVETGLFDPAAAARSGTSHWKAKLTPEKVHEIRRLRGLKTAREIAVEFGVCEATVNRVQLGQSWRAVPLLG